MSNNSRRYAGKLHYLDSEEYLDVPALIFRESEISFTLISVIEFGRWQTLSGAVATLQPDGSYLAANVTMSNGAHSEPWSITLCVEFEDPGEAIEISGRISRGSEAYLFSGELDSAA
ncbi:hypothetical protein [Coralloluteibacterium thermophilus]|uniref:Uncharacterized protein n=1 Tax=Coralloluteibacterium thermophilum TaxID=2707049 RepID=A0ABV9NIB7_9GAMM